MNTVSLEREVCLGLSPEVFVPLNLDSFNLSWHEGDGWVKLRGNWSFDRLHRYCTFNPRSNDEIEYFGTVGV